MEVAPERAADWLIRSALPAFCDIGRMFAEDSAWLRQLEPYQGHTPSGRLRGWSGVGRRVLAVEKRVDVAYSSLLRQARDIGRPVNVHDRPAIDSRAREQVQCGAVFARNVMLPSRVGWHAYRLLSTIEWFAADAGHFHGMDDEAVECIEDAWYEAWTTLGDRAVLDQLATSPGVIPIGRPMGK